MITLEEAIETIHKDLKPLGSERIGLQRSLSRILREDVVSDMDMPPFDKSAVDGYACRKEDIKNALTVVETIPAGAPARSTIGRNQCAKIMTGAVVPEGADCVLLKEEVDELPERQIRYKRDSTAVNICYQGEDVVVGQKLVPSGTRITPSNIATLALAGYHSPQVSVRPKVGVIATGDEIVEPSERPGRTKIRNSNSYQLIAHCQEFGCETRYYGIVGDVKETILSAVRKGREENDVLLLTGGISAGDLDLVPALLEETGFKILFRGIKIQPGRPTIFARLENKYVFGIPGSPVASFIVFEVLVKELLAGLTELRSFVHTAHCTLSRDVKRQKTNRIGWRPVSISADGSAQPVEYHGTAHISSYANADGMIPLPIGIIELKQGTPVEVRLF